MVADADVAVIGAGPAGAVAACLLARTGQSVLLLDPCMGRGADRDLDGGPGGGGAAPPKPGDALAGAGLRILRACDLPFQRGVHRPIGGNVSVWGGDEPIYRDFLAEPDGAGWRLDRPAFEADLIAAAQGAGARVLPRSVHDVGQDAGLWHLRLRGAASVTSRWLIDATGRATAVARRLGARRQRDEALIAVVGHARPDAAFRFERTLVETTPQGWWYAALQTDRRPVFMLHTRPAIAGCLRAKPAQWLSALIETRQVARVFPDPVLEGKLRGYEACGAWLEPVYGEGWAACGDAALSFDPCSAQGIFSALYGGMAVAEAVQAAQQGDGAALPAYAARCDEIRTAYRQRVLMHYAQERRWPEAEFWQSLSWRSISS